MAKINQKGGFTLVETIVSIAILALLMMMFAGLVLQGRTAMRDTARYDHTIGEMTAHMEVLQADGTPLPDSDSTIGVTIGKDILTKVTFYGMTDSGKEAVDIIDDDKADALITMTGQTYTFSDALDKVHLSLWRPDLPPPPEEPEAPEEGGETIE